MAAIMANEVASATSRNIGDAFTEIAARLRQSTVQVRGDGASGGSGVIWSSDGTIVTNAHVAHDTTAQVELWDGRVFSARVLARDTPARSGAAQDRRARSSRRLRLPIATGCAWADLVLAIGNPLGLHGRRNDGHRPRRRRAWAGAAGMGLRRHPARAGNSGGPLRGRSGACHRHQ